MKRFILLVALVLSGCGDANYQQESTTGVFKDYSTYKNNSDKSLKISLDIIPPTESEIEKLDISKDGKITIEDSILWAQLIPK